MLNKITCSIWPPISKDQHLKPKKSHEASGYLEGEVDFGALDLAVCFNPTGGGVGVEDLGPPTGESKLGRCRLLEICEDLFGGMPISLAIMAETQMLPKVSTLLQSGPFRPGFPDGFRLPAHAYRVKGVPDGFRFAILIESGMDPW